MSLGRAALFKYSRFKYIRSGGRNEADIGGGTGVGDAASQAVATRRRDPGAVSATNATVRLVSTSQEPPAQKDLAHVAAKPMSSQINAAPTGPTEASATPSRTPPTLLQDVYVSKLVSFSPDKERWI
ncbi:hypothetical protein PC128_g23902 [Phytophthora cactorum]|nr:hypothetical protein PC128_g23902 [Phytophthora cactorum]